MISDCLALSGAAVAPHPDLVEAFSHPSVELWS